MDFTFYVSPDGNEQLKGLSAQRNGSEERPFTSLTHARNEIRVLLTAPETDNK